jgi:hypothetical protein
MLMSSNTSVYFSPHLDDVVLSCSASLLADRVADRRVVVATLFSAGGEDATGRRLYELRRQEDRRAAAVLDVEALHLDLLDAPFRTPFYNCFRSIVFGTHPDDERHAVAVAATVRSVCEQLQPSRCYFPLAVGTHIDHRLVYRAGSELPAGPEVIFYEDRPYAFLLHGVRLRLAELGAKVAAEPLPPDLRPLSHAQLVESFRHSLHELVFIRSYLRPGEEWQWCEEELIRRLTAAELSEGPRLTPMVTAADEVGMDRISAAVAEYGSQLSILFGTVAEFSEQCRGYAARLGSTAAHAERFWRAMTLGQKQNADDADDADQRGSERRLSSDPR